MSERRRDRSPSSRSSRKRKHESSDRDRPRKRRDRRSPDRHDDRADMKWDGDAFDQHYGRKPAPVNSRDGDFGDDFMVLPDVSADEQDGSDDDDKRRQRKEDGDLDDRRDVRNRRDRDRDRDRDRHNPSGTSAPSRHAPWLADVHWTGCHNPSELLHREIEAFTRYISPSPIEDEVRGLIVKLITRAVQRQFPDAKVMPFGSFETKLYMPSGDIDLVIDSDTMAYSEKANVLRALANTLRNANITHNVTVIAKAKVPIVKFITKIGRFNVDISVNQGNGVVAGNVVNGFLRDMESGGLALRSLIMVVKCFLKQRGMNEVFSGGVGSYSVVCLCVSFLQMHPKIRRGEIDACRNLGVLLMDFFEIYGCYFNYEEVGISIRNGGSYFNKRQRGWYNHSKSMALCIEDPIDISNDVSAGSFAFQKVRLALAGAYNILTAASYQRATALAAEREGRYASFRPSSSHEMSILSTVVGITQEEINHRRLIQEVYEQGNLHKLAGEPVPLGPIQDTFTEDRRMLWERITSSSIAPQPSLSPPPLPSQPPPTVYDSSKSRTNGRIGPFAHSHGAKSIRDAWEEAEEGEVHIKVNSNASPSRAHKSNGKRKAHDDDSEDENGRYGIGRRSPVPHKRRRMGRESDAHTVFISDEEEEGELTEDGLQLHITQVGSDSEDSLAAEEKVYEDRQERSAGPSKQRTYWLAKAGKGTGEVDLPYLP